MLVVLVDLVMLYDGGCVFCLCGCYVDMLEIVGKCVLFGDLICCLFVIFGVCDGVVL